MRYPDRELLTDVSVHRTDKGDFAVFVSEKIESGEQQHEMWIPLDAALRIFRKLVAMQEELNNE